MFLGSELYVPNLSRYENKKEAIVPDDTVVHGWV